MGTDGDLAERGAAYETVPRDAVRDTFERAVFAEILPRLIAEAGGGRVLDLGCGDGMAAELAGDGLESYLGVDLQPPSSSAQGGHFVAHDLCEGLGPVGDTPFDVYLASFGVASHLPPAKLPGLLRSIAAHGRPGSLVALEALGLYSLEWPRLWSVPPGEGRLLPYRLDLDVEVHPWAPDELFAAFEEAGIVPIRALDRTVQAGPKAGEGRYWPGLAPVRQGLNALLEGDPAGIEPLLTPLPPLPAHFASEVHHALTARRRELLDSLNGESPREVAEAVWALEPASAGGFGHGLVVCGRID